MLRASPAVLGAGDSRHGSAVIQRASVANVRDGNDDGGGRAADGSGVSPAQGYVLYQPLRHPCQQYASE